MDDRRAYSDLDKGIVTDRLLALWKRHPQLRLGQLIANIVTEDRLRTIEDFQLAKLLEEQYERH